MLAHYGYSDASGEYFILIDTDRCDSCGECVRACPERVFEMDRDDYGKVVAKVKDELVSRISYVCRGFEKGCSKEYMSCQSVCKLQAIQVTW